MQADLLDHVLPADRLGGAGEGTEEEVRAVRAPARAGEQEGRRQRAGRASERAPRDRLQRATKRQGERCAYGYSSVVHPRPSERETPASCTSCPRRARTREHAAPPRPPSSARVARGVTCPAPPPPSSPRESSILRRPHPASAKVSKRKTPASRTRSRVLSTSLRAFQTPLDVAPRRARRVSGRRSRLGPAGASAGSALRDTARDSDRARALVSTASGHLNGAEKWSF
jgi:hypothetical protein